MESGDAAVTSIVAGELMLSTLGEEILIGVSTGAASGVVGFTGFPWISAEYSKSIFVWTNSSFLSFTFGDVFVATSTGLSGCGTSASWFSACFSSTFLGVSIGTSFF